jgi:hypothetical protein
MTELRLYRFKVRDPITDKWRTTRYHLTAEETRERYGEGNYELLEWSREARSFDVNKLTAGHLAGKG